MRAATACTVALVAVIATQIARAYPEGAPWGAADPAADQHCASCHWERDPVYESNAITLQGLPEQLRPNTEYELALVFSDAAAVVSGFQLIIAADGHRAGTLSAHSDDIAINVIESSARSTAVQRLDAGATTWRISWRTPATLSGPITLFTAASAANDDQSPFGDQIHYRRFDVAAAQADTDAGH
ncbi:MAG: choice-of-anchor V domain-containing protein [Pseudomonadota bacterium]